MSGAFLDLSEELETAKSDDLIAVPAWKLRLLAAAPVVTDEMVKSATEEAAKRGTDISDDARNILEAALKVKETSNV